MSTQEAKPAVCCTQQQTPTFIETSNGFSLDDVLCFAHTATARCQDATPPPFSPGSRSLWRQWRPDPCSIMEQGSQRAREQTAAGNRTEPHGTLLAAQQELAVVKQELADLYEQLDGLHGFAQARLLRQQALTADQLLCWNGL